MPPGLPTLPAAPESFNDPLKLIQDHSVDAVLIASPDDTHADMTLACLDAGKPVLCEKPLATSAEDARKVLNAETSLGRNLISVGFMRRFDPQHAAVKTTAMSGDLGKPLALERRPIAMPRSPSELPAQPSSPTQPGTISIRPASCWEKRCGKCTSAD